MVKSINIVSFDVPFPANYGGAIDVFYKLKTLSELGVEIHLHCFEYGRQPSEELNKYCSTVTYYSRNKKLMDFFSKTPFIVKTRKHDQLLKDLKQNDFPILFEGLHTCAFLSHKDLSNRIKFVRAHNIEHEYYLELSKVEKGFLRKVFFKSEAKKLRNYEQVLKNADQILTLSDSDFKHFSSKFKNVAELNVFHRNESMNLDANKENFILYHGNLSVGENINAANYLIEKVFSKLTHKVIVAGLNPDQSIRNNVLKYENVKLHANPTDFEMKKLQMKSKVHVLYTEQPTGIKLKLIDSIFSNSICIVNSKMIKGTKLEKCCEIANTEIEFIDKINSAMPDENFERLETCRNVLEKEYSNKLNGQKLIKLLEGHHQ